MQVNLLKLIVRLNDAESQVSPVIGGHCLRVGYLAYRIAQASRMSKADCGFMFVCGAIHDIGALSQAEKFTLFEEETVSDIDLHGYRGAYLAS